MMHGPINIRNIRTFPSLNIRTLRCLETSLSLYLLAQFRVQDERNPELHRYENLKTRRTCTFMSVCRNRLLLHVPSQMNWVHNFTFYTFTINVSIILPSTSRSPKSCLFLKSSDPICVHFVSLPYVSHAPPILQSPIAVFLNRRAAARYRAAASIIPGRERFSWK